jgi:propionyl-CoA synthetase
MTPKGSGELQARGSSGIARRRPSSTTLVRSGRSGSPGGRLNTCFNALDRHVRDGRGEQPALIYDSPVTNVVQRYSYRELRDEVARFAGALAREGVQRGDRVVIYMPMIPDAVIAMLACARLGAIHSVVFGGFGANELASRIADSGAKVVVCASCGVGPAGVLEYKPLVDGAIDLLEGEPPRCIVLQRPQALGTLTPGATWSGTPASKVPRPPSASRSVPAIRFTSSTPPGPRPCRRELFVTTAAMQWRWRG